VSDNRKITFTYIFLITGEIGREREREREREIGREEIISMSLNVFKCVLFVATKRGKHY